MQDVGLARPGWNEPCHCRPQHSRPKTAPAPAARAPRNLVHLVPSYAAPPPRSRAPPPRSARRAAQKPKSRCPTANAGARRRLDWPRSALPAASQVCAQHAQKSTHARKHLSSITSHRPSRAARPCCRDVRRLFHPSRPRRVPAYSAHEAAAPDSHRTRPLSGPGTFRGSTGICRWYRLLRRVDI